ncbi:MAG: hypothetical protein ACYC3X_04615 [Pirellulaceae bacterium]
MSQFLRFWIVVVCASSGWLGVRLAVAYPQDTPAPAEPQGVVVPAESVPTSSPPGEPVPESSAPPLPEIPAAVGPSLTHFPVESEAVATVCEKIEQALDAIAVVDFNETPLQDAVSYLRETYQIPIIIDQRALDDIGVGSDRPVTISLRGISLRSVLKLMLNELDLTYVVQDPVLKITTPEGAAKELAVRVYSVADLAVADRSSLVVDEQDSNYGTILRVITSHVAPESWDDVGGASSAWSFDRWGILVVSQTRENHEALDSLLAAVRKIRCSAEGATGTPADWQPVPVTSDAKRAAHDKIEQALGTVVDVEFTDTALNEVAKFLGDAHGIPIWIDRQALEDNGRGGETPVTISLQGVSLRSALRLMLRELDLMYQVDDEVLKITTPEESENELTMRIYAVRDFLESPSRAVGRPERSQSLANLLDLIESVVAPDTWDHVGGAGVLSPVDPWGLLVISQTAEVHEQVDNLLQTARRARNAFPATARASRLIAPTALETGDALLTPPTPPAVLPSAAEPVAPLTPALAIPGPVTATPPLGFVSSSGEAMILKIYTVPDFNAEQLMTAIRGVVAPETWGNGAKMAAIFPLGTRILIRQTPAAHAEIQELIDGIRPHKGSSGGPNSLSSSGGFF